MFSFFLFQLQSNHVRMAWWENVESTGKFLGKMYDTWTIRRRRCPRCNGEICHLICLNAGWWRCDRNDRLTPSTNQFQKKMNQEIKYIKSWQVDVTIAFNSVRWQLTMTLQTSIIISQFKLSQNVYHFSKKNKNKIVHVKSTHKYEEEIIDVKSNVESFRSFFVVVGVNVEFFHNFWIFSRKSWRKKGLN